MKNEREGRSRIPRSEARKLARINEKITRLNNELETLQFLQDRLERELEERPSGRNNHK